MDDEWTGERMDSRFYDRLSRYMSFKYRKTLNKPARDTYNAQRRWHKQLFEGEVDVKVNDDVSDVVVMLERALYLCPTERVERVARNYTAPRLPSSQLK